MNRNDTLPAIPGQTKGRIVYSFTVLRGAARGGSGEGDFDAALGPLVASLAEPKKPIPDDVDHLRNAFQSLEKENE